MKGKHPAAIILIIVGILSMAYATYRVIALDQSFIPLGPVGLMCAVIGIGLNTRSSS